MTDFSGKTFVVTGGSSGIGQAIVGMLTENVCTALKLDRSAPVVLNTCERHDQIDLADAAQIAAMFDQIKSHSPVIPCHRRRSGLATAISAENNPKDTCVLRRVPPPKDVADVAAFLLSDASLAITGANIEIDQATANRITAEVTTP